MNTFISISSPLKELGQGSYGRVSIFENRFAYKEYYKKDQGKYNEILILSKYKHPNIVNLVGIGVRKDDVGIVMELCQMILDDYLNLPVIKEEREIFTVVNNERYAFTHRQYVQAAHQLISAVSYLHQNGIVHGDIKGDNILIKNNNIILTDFGLSIYNTNHNREVSTIGTTEWRPLDIILISPNDEFNKIISNTLSERLSSWCAKIRQHYQGYIKYECVDIYATGLILLAILIGKPQPHSTLERHDVNVLLNDWHRNCTTRSGLTIRNHLRKMKGWTGVDGMADLLCKMITSCPWDRYKSLTECFDHQLFIKFELTQPVQGNVVLAKLVPRRDNTILTKEVISNGLRKMIFNLPVRNLTVKLMADTLITVVAYMCYIENLQREKISGSFSNYHFRYKYINTEELIDTSVKMAILMLYGELNIYHLMYKTQLDEAMLLSGGNLMLNLNYRVAKGKPFLPLDYFLTNHPDVSLEEYLEGGSRRSIFDSVVFKHKLNHPSVDRILSMYDVYKIIDDLVSVIE